MRKYEFKPWGSFINILDENIQRLNKLLLNLESLRVTSITIKEVRYG